MNDHDLPSDTDLDQNEEQDDSEVADPDSLFWQGAQVSSGFDLREYRKQLGIDDDEEY
jgi:hypothetical protein